jgi:peptidoglycan/xylan/chitin deacetylase (PgdA/CDA1 family)
MKKLSQGTFVISIDYEFAWGYADCELSEADKVRIRDEVKVVERLIELFEQYKVPATWAIVGHLLETLCDWKGDVVHPEYPRSLQGKENRDWFAQHPPQDEYSDVLWYDAYKLIPRIARSVVPHEIASHSYAHIIYGDPEVSQEWVKVDLERARLLHERNNFPATSFVFPRNSEGHCELIKNAGFSCYRGLTRTWYSHLPRILERGFRIFDYYLPTTRTVLPMRSDAGLINIPDSLMLLGRNGLRRLVSPAAMERKIKRGIAAACRENKVFHLWFHPSNFSYDTETQFAVFESVLKSASEFRNKGMLSISTMRDLAS